MKISRRRLAQELTRLIIKEPSRKNALIKQTAGYLIANKQANQAHLLIKDIALEMQHAGHVVASVDSAFPLTDATRAHIKRVLQKDGAKTVELTERVVPELMGGVVIRTPRAELDASVARQLKQISQLGA